MRKPPCPLLRSSPPCSKPTARRVTRKRPSRLWREAAGSFATVSSDTLGTSFARVPATGGGDAPPLALVGHIDEIGLAITHIDDSGLLAVTTIGGITPEMLLGQRIRFTTRNGEIIGAVARKRLTPEQIRDRPRLEHVDLHVDIGASQPRRGRGARRGR